MSEEKQFQVAQLRDFEEYATRNTWSPWRETHMAPAARPEDAGVDMAPMVQKRTIPKAFLALSCDVDTGSSHLAYATRSAAKAIKG